MTEKITQENHILQRIMPRFGSAAAAQRWFESELLPGFSGATAKQLVDQGRGDELLNFVEAVNAGLFS
jgi:hypothetical protein